MNKLKAIQSIRKALAGGKPSLGSWMQIPNGSVAEIMGAAGYDWVAVDMEHGAIGVEQLPGLFRALELGNTLPLVRVAEGTAKECKQALDAGAGGVIVPNVQSAVQLVAIRDTCRWPPAGKRGVGFCRANLFGRNFLGYSREAQAPLLVAMIEDIRAVQALDAILKVQGLDAILVGPYDLSASVGCTGDFNHPRFRAALAKIRKEASRLGIPAGVHVVSPCPRELKKRIQEGFRLIAYSIDAVLLAEALRFPPQK